MRSYLAVERERELAVRTVPCPICAMEPPAGCWYPQQDMGGYPLTSHTGRYNRAASEGLVPKLPGVDRA